MIKEGTDYEFDQTHHTGNGRHGDGDGHSAALVCSADWATYELFRIPATGGKEQYMGLRFPALRDIDISPDGTMIAFSVGDPIHAELWAIDNVLMAAPR
jgi:hypothetical protein